MKTIENTENNVEQKSSFLPNVKRTRGGESSSKSEEKPCPPSCGAACCASSLSGEDSHQPKTNYNMDEWAYINIKQAMDNRIEECKRMIEYCEWAKKNRPNWVPVNLGVSPC
jgi:hypothetical protein